MINSHKHVFLCGGAKPLTESKVQGTELNIHKNIRFEIAQFIKKIACNLTPRILDLLDIAAYVYVADQVTSRGGDVFRQNGVDWRRDFSLYVPVRDFTFWVEPKNRKILIESLNFVSDDKYDFHFSELLEPEPVQQYFEFLDDSDSNFKPDTVMLFSGGLDSLAGAIEEGCHQNKVALVTHCATSKLRKHQIGLYNELKTLYPGQFHQIPATVHKSDLPAKEYTQRTRSFLFASLALAVASAFKIDHIKFYENGIVSVNLPIAEQVVGGRASRTTHPLALKKYEILFSEITSKKFSVFSPFLEKTKTDVIALIKDCGHANLIHQATTCAHTWEKSKTHPHCGKCSQCIDRRFATLSAGCESEDPDIDYELNLFTGRRDEKEEHAQMIIGYVAHARKLLSLSAEGFVLNYPDINRILSAFPSGDRESVAHRLFNLHQRHSKQVMDVLKQGIAQHSQELAEGRLHPTCLLRSVSSEPLNETVLYGEDDFDLLLKKLVPKSKDQVAHLYGQNAFSGLSKHIGPLDFIPLHYLFSSKDTRNIKGQSHTIVLFQYLLDEFNKYVTEGYFRLSSSSPERRLKGYIKRLVSKYDDSLLKGLFAFEKLPGKGGNEEFFGVAIPPDSIKSEFKAVSSALTKD